MNEIEKIRSFVGTLQYSQDQDKKASETLGRFPFVTISRQTGAGGNSAASSILKRLSDSKGTLYEGWQKFNQELCCKVAEDPELKVSLEELLKSEYRSDIEDWLKEVVVGTAPQLAVHKKIFQLIETLALYGKVIVVGRGGMCLTRKFPLGIHIRLVAPLEMRIKNVRKMFDWPRTQAEAYIQKEDKARETFVQTYFNKNIADPLLYDAVWNTGTVSFEDIAESVVKMIEGKSKRAMDLKRGEISGAARL